MAKAKRAAPSPTKSPIISKKAKKVSSSESEEDSSEDEVTVPQAKNNGVGKNASFVIDRKPTQPDDDSDDSSDAESNAASDDSDDDSSNSVPIVKHQQSSSDDDDEEESDDTEMKVDNEDEVPIKQETQTHKLDLSVSDNSCFAMIGNLKNQVSSVQLGKFLTQKHIHFNKVTIQHMPYAIIEVPNKSMSDRLQAELNGKKFMKNQLVVSNLDSNIRCLLSAERKVVNTIKGALSTVKLHISDLPITSTPDLFKNFFPESCKPVEIDMPLKRNTSNVRGVAIVLFKDESATEEAKAFLSKSDFFGKKLRVAHYIEKVKEIAAPVTEKISGRGDRANEDLRGKTKTFLVTCLPETVNYNQVKEEFPNAHRYELNMRGSKKRNCFIEYETTEQCCDAFDKKQGVKFNNNQAHIMFVPQKDHGAAKTKWDSSGSVGTVLTIYNLPYTIKETEVKDEFPLASRVVLSKNNMGKSKGSAVLYFDSEGECQAVLDSCKERFIGGRPINARPGEPALPAPSAEKKQKEGQTERITSPPDAVLKIFNLPYNIHNMKVKALFAKSINVFLPMKEGKLTGMGVVFFKTKEDCAESLAACNEGKVKMNGRVIRGELSLQKHPNSGNTPTAVQKHPKTATSFEKNTPQKIKFGTTPEKNIPQKIKFGATPDPVNPKKIKFESEPEDVDDNDEGDSDSS